MGVFTKDACGRRRALTSTTGSSVNARVLTEGGVRIMRPAATPNRVVRNIATEGPQANSTAGRGSSPWVSRLAWLLSSVPVELR